MDDLKLYAKSEEQQNRLVKTVYVFSTNIGMEFGIKKCGILTMKRGEIIKSERIKLPDSDVMKQMDRKGTHIQLELNQIGSKKQK